MPKELRKKQQEINILTEVLLREINDEDVRLDKEKQDFINETKEFNIIKEKMSKICQTSKFKVKLNIGGTVFMTTLETLTREKDNFFSAMFSEQFNTQPDEDGEHFIDRNPTMFPYILDYLRNSTLPDLDQLCEKGLYKMFQ